MRDTRIQAQDVGEGGPMKCLWMLAGIVDYKLCDRQYDCDRCPFEAAIREGAHLHKGLNLSDQDELAGRITVQGYELMPWLFYHSSHLWARVEDAGNVRIGLDDFAQRLIGRVYAIDLPAPGNEVDSGAACWGVAHHSGETAIAAPVSGLVLQVNPKLSQHPSLINRDPYGEGWLLIIQPAHLELSLKRLYYGGRAEQWCELDVEKLYRAMNAMLAPSLPNVGATMQDGGSRIQDFKSLLTAAQMRRLIDSFLSVPVSDQSAATRAGLMGSDHGR